MSDTPDLLEPTTDACVTPGDDRLVPGWLAILVLLLVLAVVGVGGFVVRGVLESRTASDPRAADIATWRKAVEARPADTASRVSLAYAYQQAGEYDRAIAEYDKVLLSDPKDLAALYNLGAIAQTQGRAKDAENYWWRVLAIDKTHALAAKALGEYYMAQGHYRSLVEAVRPAVEAKPSLADLQYLMGFAYEKLGRPDWAGERYKLALNYAPDMQRAKAGLKRVGGGAQ